MGLMVFLLKTPFVDGIRVLASTHWSVLYALFMIYAVTAISYAFAVSTFFNNGNTAA